MKNRPTRINNGMCEHGLFDGCPHGCFDDPEQIQGIEHDWLEADGRLLMFTQDKLPAQSETYIVPFDTHVTHCECERTHYWRLEEVQFVCECGRTYVLDLMKGE